MLALALNYTPLTVNQLMPKGKSGSFHQEIISHDYIIKDVFVSG